jgi:hypothetical protein
MRGSVDGAKLSGQRGGGPRPSWAQRVCTAPDMKGSSQRDSLATRCGLKGRGPDRISVHCRGLLTVIA